MRTRSNFRLECRSQSAAWHQTGAPLRPVRIHLDTSDYVAMHKAVSGTDIAQSRENLKGMAAGGQVEIGLSYHIVFEFLQKADPGYREDRLARARLLKELCGRNAFHTAGIRQGACVLERGHLGAAFCAQGVRGRTAG